MLVNFPKVFKGTHTSHPKVSDVPGDTRRARIARPAVPMDVYADGERVGPLPAAMEAVKRRTHRTRSLTRNYLPWASASARSSAGPVT